MGFGVKLSDITDAISTAHTTTDGKVDVVDAVVDAVQERTDNLPDDPADESALEAAITAAHATTDGLVTAAHATTDGLVTTVQTLAAVLDLADLKQETAPATDVNGTTWKDLLDKSTITKPTKVCGFKVTKGGTWTGNVKIRMTDGAGNKIFPFQDEYVEGTDFADASQAVFNFPVVVPVADGYKFQFRSTSAADGAGETLQLNNLDVIEIG